MRTGPFQGLRVLELGRFIAVPFCGQMLAEGGADVIKVEDLDGDQTRHNGPILPFEGKQFFNKNRGKRSLAVELTDSDVVAAVRQLASRADVVLANFRPGLSSELGLDYDSVRATNPRVVYAENTAYGLEGDLAGVAGMDIVLQAFTGLAHMTEHGPDELINPIIDYAAAMLMAWGVSTALYHRERTGEGQKLDVALLQAAMILENNQLTHVDVIDAWRGDFLEYLKGAFAAGETWADVVARRAEMQPHRVMRAYYGFFDTADGAIATACNAKTLRVKMAALLQLDDRWTNEPGWLPGDVNAHESFVRDQVIAKFKSRTTADWVATFRAKGLPIGPVRHSDEMFEDPQPWANGFLTRVEHEVLGGITVVAPPVRFSATPMQALAPVPLGRQSREILAEAGLSAAQVASLFDRGVAREVHETLANLA
jgi:formyl-CoA transferase